MPDDVYGHPPAERELCERFASRIHRYGLRHLRNEDRARDLVQAVLVAVIVALREDRIEDPTRLDRYVLGTCRHLAQRVRQGEARVTATDPQELDVGSFLPNELVADTPALYRCLSALELRARTVVHLSFYRDQDAEEIAHLLDTTPGNVRVVRHRAIAQLRSCLEGDA